jgi:DNA-binding GntR family transcriptional regulator
MSNPLHAEIAAHVLSSLKAQGARPGDMVSDAAVARELGVSRTPVRAAFEQLAAEGVLAQRRPRGWQVAGLPESAPPPPPPDRQLYGRLLRDRAVGALDAEVFESDLMTRYAASRGAVKRALERLAAEGLVERRRGHGWRFVEAIASDDALMESYVFREMLECGALLRPEWRDDLAERAALTERHRAIMALEPEALDPAAWFETNRRFHDHIAAGSDNRFVARALAQQNQLRRLWEYAEFTDLTGARIRQSCAEHLAILEAIAEGDRAWAAALLARHLRQAAR